MALKSKTKLLGRIVIAIVIIDLVYYLDLLDFVGL